MTVWLLLLLDHSNVGITHLLQDTRDRPETGAIQRCVHDGDIFIHFFPEQHRLCFDLVYESSVDLLRDVPDTPRCQSFLKAAGLDIGKDIQLLNLRQNLSGGLPW